MDIDYEKIGKRIKKTRKARGYTQETLANMVGISIPYMSHVETADSKIGLQTLIKIANALEISANDLLCDSLIICTDSYDKEYREFKDSFGQCTPEQKEKLLAVIDQTKRIFF